MKKISILVSEFINVLLGTKCCQFVSFSYVTDVDAMNKKLIGGRKNTYYGRLQSITEMSGCQFNANYENAVNNRLPQGTDGKGEKFVAESLPWGVWMPGAENKLITHKGETYVRFYKTPTAKTDVTYILDGNTVTDKATIKDIIDNIRPASSSNRQAAAGIEIERQVKPFTINAKNLRRVNMDKVAYTLVNF